MLTFRKIYVNNGFSNVVVFAALYSRNTSTDIINSMYHYVPCLTLHSAPYTYYQGLDILCSHISEQSTTTYFN